MKWLPYTIGFQLTAIALWTQPEPAPEPPIKDGVYLVQGSEGKEDYTAICLVHKVRDDLYLFQWVSKGIYTSGLGMVDGDRVFVSWEIHKTGVKGMTLYRIEKGKMTGHWSAFVKPAKNKETLTFLRALEIPDA